MKLVRLSDHQRKVQSIDDLTASDPTALSPLWNTPVRMLAFAAGTSRFPLLSPLCNRMGAGSVSIPTRYLKRGNTINREPNTAIFMLFLATCASGFPGPSTRTLALLTQSQAIV